VKRLSRENELTPPSGTKINFGAAVVFARKIDMAKKLVALTGAHRGMRANLDRGWLIIEQQWYSK
jgi:hypothetical protein